MAIPIALPTDVKRANDASNILAKELGFVPDECDQIALAVAELGSNLIKHAGGGTITLRALRTGARQGIQIESEDSGPGIADVELALTDGFSSAGSLGAGLGAVNRAMDDLQFHTLPAIGLRIVCQRWVRPRSNMASSRALDIGAATRACRFLPENGDAFVIKQWPGAALVGIIDGLGHGPSAQKAAQLARQYVEQHFDQPLPNLFRGVERACRATRGAVMALCRLDLARRTLAVANVGNIEVRLIGPDPFNPVIRRGVLGLRSPEPVASEHPWRAASLLILNSDGVRAHWQWEQFKALAAEPAGIIARQLLNALGKTQDDATVVVVKNANP